MLPCVWFSNRSQKTSKCGKNIRDTLGYASCATFLFLPHFDVICDLLLNRRTATWNLFVNFFIFSAQEMFGMTLVFFRPETRDVATRALDIVYGSFAIYVRWLFGWRYISSPDTQCWRAQKERNSCPLVRSCFIGSCHVGVSKRFSRSISLAVYCLYTFSFWLIRPSACCIRCLAVI